MEIKWNQFSKRETIMYFSNPDYVRLVTKENLVIDATSEMNANVVVKFDCLFSKNEELYAKTLAFSIKESLKKLYPDCDNIIDQAIQINGNEIKLMSFHITINRLDNNIRFGIKRHAVTDQQMIQVTIAEELPEDDQTYEV
jgi:4'-phosphopantetheinyl transferase EntD